MGSVRVFANLQPQAIMLDFEFGELVLAHEIEDLLQLLDVDDQSAIAIIRI